MSTAHSPVVRHRRTSSSPGLCAWALLLLMTLGLGACAAPPSLRSEVVLFHAWQAGEPMSFAIRTPAPA
ncbi:MAG: hypothetical protein EHM87_18165, partial [Burkholderiales bacterium]